MRRAVVAALFFIILLFICVAGFAVTSFMLETVHDTMNETAAPMLDAYGQSMFRSELTRIRTAFGWFSLLFVIIICVLFVFDALRQEPEEYWGPPYE